MKGKGLSDDATMKLLLTTLKSRLDELDDPRHNRNLFVQGEFCAYKDCLKMAMAWSGARDIVGSIEDDDCDITKRRNGLRFLPDIEVPRDKLKKS